MRGMSTTTEEDSRLETMKAAIKEYLANPPKIDPVKLMTHAGILARKMLIENGGDPKTVSKMGDAEALAVHTDSLNRFFGIKP